MSDSDTTSNREATGDVGDPVAPIHNSKERLGQGRRESVEEFTARWMKLTAKPDRDPNEPELSLTHGGLLYDEDGLPKIGQFEGDGNGYDHYQ